jgi:copper chaperone CopZ
MKHWCQLLPIIAIMLASRSAVAEELKVQYRLTGLFQPDRVDDLRRQAGSLLIDEKDGRPDLKLVEVNYDAAVVTFAYDTNSKHFKNQKPEQVLERINGLLSNVSKGSFKAFPLSKPKPDQLKEVRIAVAGLDCKGCAYSAYRSIATIEGVDHAVVSFKDGQVTAWIDSAKTNRDALVAALKKAEVDVIDAEKPQNKK